MGTYKYTGTPQFVTVTTTGDYDILAVGAQGGGDGGYGAEIGGTVQLTAGEKLEIVVGGRGSFVFSGGAASGGDGSFVLGNIGGKYQPLVIAGGGGGGASGQPQGGVGRTTKSAGGTSMRGYGGAYGGKPGTFGFYGAGGSGYKDSPGSRAPTRLPRTTRRGRCGKPLGWP